MLALGSLFATSCFLLLDSLDLAHTRFQVCMHKSCSVSRFPPTSLCGVLVFQVASRRRPRPRPRPTASAPLFISHTTHLVISQTKYTEAPEGAAARLAWGAGRRNTHLIPLLTQHSSHTALISHHSSHTITQPLILYHSSRTAHRTPCISHQSISQHSFHTTHLPPVISRHASHISHQSSDTPHLSPVISHHHESSHTVHRTPLISQHSNIHYSSYTTHLIPNAYPGERHKTSHLGLCGPFIYDEKLYLGRKTRKTHERRLLLT